MARKPKPSTKTEPKPTRKECDLAPPIAAYLAEQGYCVRSEVNHCDITATQNDTLVVVELKRNFSTDLLIQAIDRQRIADSVYVALPVEGGLSKRDRYSKRWKGVELLLKRLGLGLFVVGFPPDTDAAPTVEVVFHPITEAPPRKRPKSRASVLREIAGRSGDYNVGGVTGRPILTAYREQAIFIACCLDKWGPQTPTALRKRGTCEKTQAVLFRNVYNWFERLDRGLYGLRASGKDEIARTYPGLAALYSEKISEAVVETAVIADAPEMNGYSTDD